MKSTFHLREISPGPCGSPGFETPVLSPGDGVELPAQQRSPRGALWCPLQAAGRSTGCPEVGSAGGGGGPARRSRVPVDDRREHQDELLSSVYVNINDSYSLRTCISVYVCVTRSAVSDFLRPTSRIAGRFFTI